MNRPANRHGQRGVVFYLFVVFALMMMAAVLAGLGGLIDHRSQRSVQAKEILEQTRELLLAELVQPELGGAATRPGQWVRFPDLPISVGVGVDASEPNFDGLSESAGCASRTWTPGQPLVPVSVSAVNARCFGRVHWLDLGLSTQGDPQVDAGGLIPWVVFSPNLAATPACLPNLNPLALARPYAGYACPSALPYPWLTVLDARGNVVSDRVAFAVILPGPALPGQVRGPAAPASAWLDRLEIAANCAQPCRPGRYDNAGFAHANGQPSVLIQAPTDGPKVDRGTDYVLPHAFNDRLLYVTADELFERIERRARIALQRELLAYRNLRGHFPYAASLDSSAGDCVSNLRFGHPAVADGNCGAGNVASLPAWITQGGWHRYFVYAVSSRCHAGSAGCGAPGLVLDARNDIDALLFSPGPAITVAPFAPSRIGAQQPLLLGLIPSLTAGDYLDSIENAAGLPDVFARVAPGSGADNDRIYTLP